MNVQSLYRGALLAASLLIFLIAAAPAAAASGRCFGGSTGPSCHVVYGKVTDVNDGDTIDVRSGGRTVEIRLRSIQAMEMTSYARGKRRGPCHSVGATRVLEKLVKRKRVRLATQIQDGRDRLGRFRRAVAIRSGGRWRDVGEILLQRGHVLYMTSADEPVWNARYNLAQQQAARRGRNLWNPTKCGRGPQQNLPIDVWLNWEAFGEDAANVNGEWIKIRNRGSQALNLGRWWVRDAMLRRFTFPRGTRVAPGATITVFVGRGQRRPGVFYWGQPRPIFENANGDGRNFGDGAYLFDPKGDLRSYMLYPCVVACADSRRGAIKIEAHPRRPESVRISNVSSRLVDLYPTQLALGGSAYDFGPDSVLQPGEDLVVETGGDPSDDTRYRRHWGIDGYMLPDSGGSVRLRTFSRIDIACYSWGDGDCG